MCGGRRDVRIESGSARRHEIDRDRDARVLLASPGDITFDAPSTQWWSPLAAAITFGVLFASPLTLLFTPCALELQGRFYDWWARQRGARPVEERAQAE